VLLDGPIPLDVLEQNIGRWIEKEKVRIAARG